mmetsp:Transcript_59402/g.105982  ORF Transcript_59402/g.105982 Transcript_59402/m.105982 type:complete len:119 (+) Transcript_59402:2617-2973(+)
MSRSYIIWHRLWGSTSYAPAPFALTQTPPLWHGISALLTMHVKPAAYVPGTAGVPPTMLGVKPSMVVVAHSISEVVYYMLGVVLNVEGDQSLPPPALPEYSPTVEYNVACVVWCGMQN